MSLHIRNEERNKQVLKMRNQGFTYKQIAERFHISLTRAQQIASAQARRETEPNMGDILSTRAMHALYRSGIKTEEEIINKIKDGSIQDVKNIGEKSIRLLKHIYDLENVETLQE